VFRIRDHVIVGLVKTAASIVKRLRVVFALLHAVRNTQIIRRCPHPLIYRVHPPPPPASLLRIVGKLQRSLAGIVDSVSPFGQSLCALSSSGSHVSLKPRHNAANEPNLRNSVIRGRRWPPHRGLSGPGTRGSSTGVRTNTIQGVKRRKSLPTRTLAALRAGTPEEDPTPRRIPRTSLPVPGRQPAAPCFSNQVAPAKRSKSYLETSRFATIALPSMHRRESIREIGHT